jgi:outer membrane protein assembly factor BamD
MAVLRLSALPVGLFLAAALAACSTTPQDVTADWSANRLYQEAMDEKGAGNLEKAITQSCDDYFYKSLILIEW